MTTPSTMTYRTIVLLLALLGAVTAMAQPPGRKVPERSVFVDYGDRFFGETVVVPGPKADSATMIVLFRMANDFLLFTTVTDRSDNGGAYRADMAVSIEVRDSIGVIRQRVPWKGVAYTASFEETNSKVDFHYGWASLKIPRGRFTVSLELLTQKESNSKKLTLPDVTFTGASSKRAVTMPLVVEELAEAGSDTYKPYVFGGNVPFQPRDATAIVLVGDSTSATYDYTITQRPYAAGDIRWWMVSDVRGSATARPGVLPYVSDLSTNDRPVIRMAPVDGVRTVASLTIPVPVTALVPGQYDLAYVRQGGSDTIRSSFRVYWEMMPLSLRNLQYAIEIVRYIVTEQEYDALDGGNDTERRGRLMEFWRTKDPTPLTSFNEHQYEYYRRVDAAFYAYATIQEPDGAKSERGKIAILHGQPTSVRKVLGTNDRGQEIWTYANAVAKTFTFEIDDSGIYRLRTITPLN